MPINILDKVDVLDKKESDFLIKNNNTMKTKIFIADPHTGELIFRGSNKIVIAGAGFTARSHFALPRVEKTPSYNALLDLEESFIENPFNLERVYLFAVGINGCGAEPSQVYEVDYSKCILPEHLVPFRYQLTNEDLDAANREKYFGRKTLETKGRIAYYFKNFESEPVFKQQYVDGTPITSDIYSSTRTDEIESYVELKLKVSEKDCRDFFIETTGINSAKINQISLLTCWPKQMGEFYYYQDIRPLTVYNMVNEPLIDLSKGIDITYQLFY